MANKVHLEILLQGVKTWNQWREENEDIKPDLSGVNLSGQNLGRIDFVDTNLSGAMLRNTDVSNG